MSDEAPSLTRRRFLGGVLVLGLAVVPPGLVSLLRSQPEDDGQRAVGRLRGLFADPSEMRPMGRAYLDGRPDRPSERELLAELLPPELDVGSVNSLSDDELREVFRQWAVEDLVAGRLEAVDGWLLGRSEVQIAALVGVPPASSRQL